MIKPSIPFSISSPQNPLFALPAEQLDLRSMNLPSTIVSRSIFAPPMYFLTETTRRILSANLLSLGTDLPPCPGTNFRQGLYKQFAIFLILKNRFPSISPAHEMISRSGVFDSRFSSHTVLLFKSQIIFNLIIH